MTILIIGECYSINLGDPLLCSTVSKILKDYFLDAEILQLDLSGKISMSSCYIRNTERTILYKIKNRAIKSDLFSKSFVYLKEKYWFLTEQISNLLKAVSIDLVIFAGGQMFMDYFAERIYVTVKLLKGIRIIFHACGMHKELSHNSICLFRKVINMKNVLSVSVRDSYTTFIKLFNKNKIINTYDTALLCSEYYSGYKGTHKYQYGIGIIESSSLYSFQKDLISQLLRSNLEWRLFTNGSEGDYNTAVRLLLELGIQKDKIFQYLVCRPKTAEELVFSVTRFERIISFRLHSLIVAASFGIPSFGFVWDEKIIDFYKNINIPNYSYPENLIRLEKIISVLDETNSSFKEVVQKCQSCKKVLLDCVCNSLML